MQAPPQSARFEHLVLVGAAALVIAPLLVRGPSCGHDFDFHLLNWLEVANQFRHGALHPTWAVTPAWNAGEPRFVFYPPISWALGSLLTLVALAFAAIIHSSPALVFATVPVAYTFLALLAGGVALFHVACPWAGRTAALLSAVLYMCGPYALFTAYERTAYGELLSMPLFPLLLQHALVTIPSPPRAGGLGDAVPQRDSSSVALLAITFALLCLSNAPAAIMGSYAFLALALLRLGSMIADREPAPQLVGLAWRWTAGVALGFALAAFFLLPAIAERAWVQLGMAMIPGMRPDDNTLFHHTGDLDHDAVLHAASVVASVVVAILLVAFAAYRIRHRTSNGAGLLHRQTATALFVSGCIVIFALTPPALPLWHYAPDLAVLQFPWRLLAVLATLVALLCALAMRGLRLRRAPLAALSVCIAIALTAPAYYAFHQACDAEDTPEARLSRFTAGTPKARGSEPTDEYTPTAADNDALSTSNAPFWLLSPGVPDDASAPSSTVGGPAPHVLHLHLDHATRLVLNLRDYPTWAVTRNGVDLPGRIARSDGLLTVPLPAGDSDLRIAQRSTGMQQFGALVSLLALVVLIALWVHERRQRLATAIGRLSRL